MEWQQFRDRELWCLEINDLITLNKKNVDRLYQWCSSGPKSSFSKNVHLKDTIGLFAEADYRGSEMEKRIAVCYSLSKMTIVDEMEHFDRYLHLKRPEFYEFLCRMAQLMISTDILVKKVEKLLGILFAKILNEEVIIPSKDENGIESESDCDD